MKRQADIARLIKRGATDAAEQLCQAELVRAPTDPQTWYYLSAVQSTTHRREEALRSLKVAASHLQIDNAASQLGSGSTAVQLGLRIAQALLRLHAYHEALALYQQLPFSVPQVVLGIGRCHWILGRHEQALTSFDGLWQVHSDWPELGLTFARALSGYGRLQAAGAVLSHLLARYPEHRELQHQYTLWLISNDGVQAAWRWLLKQSMAGVPAKLNLLYRALAVLQQADLPKELPLLPEQKTNERWMGFQRLNDEAISPHWFGDVTRLLSHTCRGMGDTAVYIECGTVVERGPGLSVLRPDNEVYVLECEEQIQTDNKQLTVAAQQGRESTAAESAAKAYHYYGSLTQCAQLVAERLQQPVALVRLANDDYATALQVLMLLKPKLQVGTVIVFDHLFGHARWQMQAYRAWQKWLEQSGFSAMVTGAVVIGRAVSFQLR